MTIFCLPCPARAPRAMPMLMLPKPMLQGLSCSAYAAGAMPQGQCRTGYAAGAMLQGLYCRLTSTDAGPANSTRFFLSICCVLLHSPCSCYRPAAGAMRQGLCCRGSAARAMLQGLRCRGSAAGAMLHGLCERASESSRNAPQNKRP